MPKYSKFISPNLLSEDKLSLNVLPMYGLNNANLEQIKIKNTDKHRAVYKISSSSNQNYCLKKVYYSEEHLLFIYSVLEWLGKRNVCVPRFLPTIDKNRFVSYNDMLFVLTPWVEGNKCSYDNISDIVNASKTLANLHKKSKNFKPIPGSIVKKGYDNIYISISKHFNKLLNCNNFAFIYKDKFSKLFLDNFNANISLAQFALEISSSIKTSNLTSSLCHGDYVNKNIIADNKNNLWVIDFDKCCLDFIAHDISYYLRRLLKRDSTKWNVQLAISCLKSYSEINPLSSDDLKYILVYLSFPQKYWKISRDYFNNIHKCNKTAFYNLLSKTTCKTEFQVKFINEFCKDLKREFNVKI